MDCLLGLKDIPDNYIDLVIIDPPYYILLKVLKKEIQKLLEILKYLKKNWLIMI